MQPADRGHVTKKLFIKTYGCQMNVYDSDRMADVLRPLGYDLAAAPDDADLVVLNTCHIREHASEKVYSELGRCAAARARARGRGRDLTSPSPAASPRPRASCIAGRAPAVDIVVGPQAYHRLPELLARPSARPSRCGRRHRFPGGEQVRPPAGAAGPRRVGVPVDPGRLRQVLHLLRRALYARRRIFAAGRRRPGRGARAGRAPARSRSRCSARTSTPITARARTARPGRSPA